MTADSSERGSFIVLDGVDGCGKTTQAERLVQRLRAQGVSEVLHLREPGGTALGEALRGLLLSRDHDPGSAVETLLFAASRRQMLDELVGPALERGAWVVCERFHPSTFAYQAWAGDLDPASVMALLEGWAGTPRPELVCVLDLPVESAARRRGDPTDRIEDKGLIYQQRVAEGYRSFAERYHEAVLIDGSESAEQVEAAVWEEVSRRAR
jgi:dTMP kinase